MMNTISLNRHSAKIIAHRGLSGLETENTNAAFVAAGNRSYFGIETDVHKTADEKFMIIHDDNTQRVADKALDVETSTFEALRALNLKDSGGGVRSDLKIPELFEYIRICRKYGKIAVLELKNQFSKEEIQQIVAIIETESYLKNTIFISFALNNLLFLREILPSAQAQYLVSEYSDSVLQALKRHKLDLDIYYPQLTPENIAELKQNNIKINCWTCDDPAAAESLAALGVDYITSNILE